MGNIKKYDLWQRKKYPVLMLHLSFILIILGAGITRYISYEGIMPIYEGETTNRMLSDKAYVDIHIDNDEEQKAPLYEHYLFASTYGNSSNFIYNTSKFFNWIRGGNNFSIKTDFKGDEEMNSSGGRKNWAKREAPLTNQKTASKAELEYERKKRAKLEQELAALKAQQQQRQQTISSDTKLPTITIASASTKDKQGIIRGKARDNTGIAEVTIGGKSVPFDASGNFKFETFVPADGKQVVIQVTDLNGLSNSKTVKLDRSASAATASIITDMRLSKFSAAFQCRTILGTSSLITTLQ